MQFLHQFGSRTIKERTKAGLTAARSRGRVGGRPKTVSSEKIRAAVDLYQKKNSSVPEICRLLKISERSFYRHKIHAENNK